MVETNNITGQEKAKLLATNVMLGAKAVAGFSSSPQTASTVFYKPQDVKKTGYICMPDATSVFTYTDLEANLNTMWDRYELPFSKTPSLDEVYDLAFDHIMALPNDIDEIEIDGRTINNKWVYEMGGLTRAQMVATMEYQANAMRACNLDKGSETAERTSRMLEEAISAIKQRSFEEKNLGGAKGE